MALPGYGRWDADRNTDEFVRCLPLYREHGLTAVTVNLQGGAPFGYYRAERFRQLLAERQVAYTDAEMWRGLPGSDSQPWHNSPFAADGALVEEPGGHLARLSRILQRTDELGMVVVLGIFYFGQDERLRDEAAVCRAVEETCGWVLQQGWRNVVIEVNNECDVPRYEHEILRPHRVHELIARAQRVTRDGDRLLVGTSYGGGRIPGDAVCAASDFIMLHGNGVADPRRIAAMVDRTRALPGYAGQADHVHRGRPLRLRAAGEQLHRGAVAAGGVGSFDPGPGAGGGLAPGNYVDGFQSVPINWTISTPRKRAFFDLLRQVTGA